MTASVRYRFGRACGWRRGGAGRKVQAMDTTLTRTDISAPPGSRRQDLDLAASAASQRLGLRAGQQALLQVSQGCLWLTQDGRPDDIILRRGEQLRLQEPGIYRLGALGPDPLRAVMWTSA